QSSNVKFDYKALRTPGPYGNLILIEPVYENKNPNHIINISAGACHMRMESRYFKEGKRYICKIFLNRTFLAEGIGDTKKAASGMASESGLEMLKRMYYTVKVKIRTFSDGPIEKKFDTDDSSSSAMQPMSDQPPIVQPPIVQSTSVNTPQDDNNIGSRLLRLMGWSGGGLNKNAQGFAEPVSVKEHISRAGLGREVKGQKNQQTLTEKALINKRLCQLIEDYANSDSEKDLVFSEDFTKEEMRVMETTAKRLRLKIMRLGNKRNRHLAISRKQDIWDTKIIHFLLENTNKLTIWEKFNLQVHKICTRWHVSMD
ncbi:hypothetical protein L9F63_010050, partial [Diploptera punctata]